MAPSGGAELTGLDDAARVLRAAVGAAILAPSSHNTQPWRFKIDGSRLEIYADDTRQLGVIDATRRQLLQSCGCALFNARVAVRAMGYRDEVTIILADGDRPSHLATLQLGPPHVATAVDRALVDAIPCRRTNRREFLDRPVSQQIGDDLCAAAAREGVIARRLDPEQKRVLGRLIADADRLQYEDPAFRAELARWLTATGSRRRDGIPFVEKEYGSALPFSVMRALRSPHIGANFADLEREHVLGAPVVLVIGTRSDDPADWVASGQAIEAVLLHATSLGLSASFLNQVLEIPALRVQTAELVPEIDHPQTVLRIGVPAEPVHRVAPRRDVEDVLEH